MVDVDEALNYARAYSGTPRPLERARACSRSILLAGGLLVGEPRGGAGYGSRCHNRTVVWHSRRRHIRFPASTWRPVGSGQRSDSDYI